MEWSPWGPSEPGKPTDAGAPAGHTFPYDGRAGSGYVVVVVGVLWRPVDHDALTSITVAWRRAESIARTFEQPTRAGDPQLLPPGPAAPADH